MKLLFLGTTGYHPNNRRHTACFMLPEIGVILDAGTGIFRARDHLQTDQLQIFLSHAHVDHVVGLTFLFDILYDRPIERVQVHGESAKLEAIEQHLFSPLLFPVMPPIDFCPLPDQGCDLPQQGRLTHFPLEHPGGSLGFRLDWPDRSMAYVTDTTARPDASYVDQIRGVDLLIHECYFPDSWQQQAELTGHSWTSAVAQVAKQADVGQLFLVHINPLVENDDPVGIDVARRIFPETHLAFDGWETRF